MLLFLLPFVLLHPVHETVSEIQWNDQTKRLEVSLRLDVLDEQWVRKRVIDDKRLVREGETASWAIGYLRDTFRITAIPKKGQKDSTSYHWLGREQEGSHVWWYFEIEPFDRSPPNWLLQRMLFEREPKHVNRILILGQVPRRSLVLTMNRPQLRLDQAKSATKNVESPPTQAAGTVDR